MNEIRKEIRKILKEYHGVQNEIKELSQQLTEEVKRRIELESDKISDGNLWELKSQVRLNQKLIEVLKISLITIDIEFQNSGDKFEGAFLTNKTKLMDDESYSIIISLKIHSEKVDYRKINYIISHELNHAFVEVKGISGKRKANIYNKARNITRSELKKYSEEYPEINQFLEMVYLSNPLEVQARVQETINQLEDSNEKDAEDTIDYLLRFQPLSDARKMLSYSTEKVLELDKIVLQDLIDSFNKSIKQYSENQRTYSDIDNFFSYWKKVINKSGETLARKIYKLVSDKYSLNEIDLYEHESFGWVFQKSFNDWLWD